MNGIQYPLAFPRGDNSFSLDIPSFTGKNLTPREFFSSWLMNRPHHWNIFHHLGQLFQFVDWYARIESDRLRWYRLNQQDIRSNSLRNLQDAMANHADPNNTGVPVILPSTFIFYFFQEKTQDAMSYVTKFGHPDLFITFTCNPKWDEIVGILILQQNYSDRHDLIARVFNGKITLLISFLHKYQIFGVVTAYKEFPEIIIWPKYTLFRLGLVWREFLFWPTSA
jgi:hypothetical protein